MGSASRGHAAAGSGRPHPVRSVLLCGMMGSGKSTVGRLLAERLEWAFIDTDQEVERVSGRTIEAIFDREGEASFRKLERRVFEGLPAARAVIALGGGAVASAENRDLLRTKGTIVWLDAPVEALVERIGEAALRPLLADRTPEGRTERLRELLSERAQAYAKADLRVDTARRTPCQVCDRVLEELCSSPEDTQ